MARAYVVYVFFVFVHEKVFSEDSLCPHENECIPLSQCNPIHLSSFIYPCHSGLNLHCCPSKGVKNSTAAHLLARRTKLFPVNCGVVAVDDKIIGGKTANLGQFPWMALLGYKQKHLNITEYLCGGTVITETFVLTAAHCIVVGNNHKLITVRVGEHDLQSKKDCITIAGVQICTDDPVDLPVEQYFKHPNYDSKTFKNDIGLIKVKTSIPFTDFIQPICLPFERHLETKDLTGQKFTISGWGKTESKKLGGSPVLQFARVRAWAQSDCEKVIPPEVQPLTETQICANGKKEDACKGDSGGPLSNATLDMDGLLRNFQIGIVSFASTLTCGIEELPPIYTRVDKYLEWITDNIQ